MLFTNQNKAELTQKDKLILQKLGIFKGNFKVEIL